MKKSSLARLLILALLASTLSGCLWFVEDDGYGRGGGRGGDRGGGHGEHRGEHHGERY